MICKVDTHISVHELYNCIGVPLLEAFGLSLLQIFTAYTNRAN